MRLFFYERAVSPEESVEASFNIDLVTQTVAAPDDQIMVFLGDFRRDLREVEIPLKNGAKRLEIRELDTFSSILLNKQDAERFKSLYSVQKVAEIA